jgi:hypothetical protein
MAVDRAAASVPNSQSQSANACSALSHAFQIGTSAFDLSLRVTASAGPDRAKGAWVKPREL